MFSDHPPINLLDYEQLARDKLTRTIFDYFAGGSDDSITLRENSAAYDRIRLRPRILVDVDQRNMATTLLGKTLSSPFIVAPMALAGMAHPDADIAIARGADNTPVTISTLSSYSLEEIAEAAQSPLWFQLYVYRDRSITQKLVERAEAAGYQALVVTVDGVVAGNRERDRRNEFKLPENVTLKNLYDAKLDRVIALPGESSVAAYFSSQIDPSFSWKDLEWLRSITKLPIILKGILRADDARRAHDHGAAAIVVSNHGGRQLDTVPASIDVLPEIAAEIGNAMPILLDSGIRRGTDVLKALALGANAVMIGRPVMWGLAVDGEEGVRRVLEIIQEELDTAMALCGCPSLNDIDADLIWNSAREQ